MASPKPQLMRDAVINEIYTAAQRDKDILFISADLGAAALDEFRETCPASSFTPAFPSKIWSTWRRARPLWQESFPVCHGTVYHGPLL